MTTSRLVPELIPRDKGLDLQTAKIIAPAGSVLDSLNYEQVDFLGQKRIDGYVRYDGSLGSYQDVLYIITISENFPINSGDAIFLEDETLVGIAVSSLAASQFYMAIINQNYAPQAGDVYTAGVVISAEELKESFTYSDQYTRLLEANAALRARVTDLPGPVAGLHWFNDRLYAVASAKRVDLGADHGYMPNDIYLSEYPVLARDATSITIGGVTHDFPGVTSDIASLYQSRTEQQALDELGDVTQYGWSFVHQGWNVPFVDGISLYGALPALNLNLQGLGVQGPTSTAGDNGRPLVLIQDVQMASGQAQVNGWKSSNTPNSYNLDPNNVREEDSLYIYADAYLSWNGDNGNITIPGITTPVLTEYPANGTVEVEI